MCVTPVTHNIGHDSEDVESSIGIRLLVTVSEAISVGRK